MPDSWFLFVQETAKCVRVCGCACVCVYVCVLTCASELVSVVMCALPSN